MYTLGAKTTFRKTRHGGAKSATITDCQTSPFMKGALHASFCLESNPPARGPTGPDRAGRRQPVAARTGGFRGSAQTYGESQAGDPEKAGFSGRKTPRSCNVGKKWHPATSSLMISLDFCDKAKAPWHSIRRPVPILFIGLEQQPNVIFRQDLK